MREAGREVRLRENCGLGTLGVGLAFSLGSIGRATFGERRGIVRLKNREADHRRVGPMRSFSAKEGYGDGTGIYLWCFARFILLGGISWGIYTSMGKILGTIVLVDRVKGAIGNGTISHAT